MKIKLEKREMKLITCPTYSSLRLSKSICIQRQRQGRWLMVHVKKRINASGEAQGLMVCAACQHVNDPEQGVEAINPRAVNRYTGEAKARAEAKAIWKKMTRKGGTK